MTEFPLESLMCHRDNLEHVLDNLQEGIIAHDLQRRVFFFNREAERITGYGRAEVLGRDCHEAFGTPFCGGAAPSANPRRIRPKVPTIPSASSPSPGSPPHRDDGHPHARRHRRPTGILASFRDVTDLVRLQLRTGDMTRFGNIIGHDSKMLSVFKQIRDVAGYDYPVHVSGETGTGKELVANAIHHESRRAGAPFVPINCGALPEGLIETELFGHVKGAFSGAIRDKKGRFELADGGTVFLDEVAELSNTMQVKLLRFLQEGKFERVGGEQTLRVNVRVISATNRNLKEVERNRFREDLFYRLT